MRSLTKHLSMALLAFGLALTPVSLASAQTDADRGGGENRNLPEGSRNAPREHEFSWGLLGLLGLVGLIPLFVGRDNGYRRHDQPTTTARGPARA